MIVRLEDSTEMDIDSNQELARRKCLARRFVLRLTLQSLLLSLFHTCVISTYLCTTLYNYSYLVSFNLPTVVIYFVEIKPQRPLESTEEGI